MTLVARTRRIDENVDLLAFASAAVADGAASRGDGVLFERGRAGLAGRGEAMRLAWTGGDAAASAREAADGLAEIETDDEVGLPGCGPVAFGALPFAPGTAAELVVPQIVAGRSDDGSRWLTVIGHDDQPLPSTRNLVLQPDADPLGRRPQPSRFTVESTKPADEWHRLVTRATKLLAENDATLSKIVLAREVTVTADKPLDRPAVLRRLRAAYPDCYLASVDGLLAASPELLVSRRGDAVRSHPMAGTAPRGGDPTTDQRLAASLLASSKDRQEHQITIDMVQDTLLGWCSYVDYEAEPSVVAVANVQHLATLIEGRLSEPAPSVLELVAALHPTPAVAGWPRERALRWIAQHEGIDRRRYAGPVGWVDRHGNGTWAVAVRSAEVRGATAHVYAGNGIVADSDPEIELAETRAKLQAMLSAIVTP
jgi:menaquinone-specific isochorismate synthase